MLGVCCFPAVTHQFRVEPTQTCSSCAGAKSVCNYTTLRIMCQDHKYDQMIHCSSNQGQELGFIKLSIRRGEAVGSNGLNYYITVCTCKSLALNIALRQGLNIPYLFLISTSQQLYREIPIVTCLVKKGYVMLCYLMFWLGRSHVVGSFQVNIQHAFSWFVFSPKSHCI